MNATRLVALVVVAFFTCAAAHAATIPTVPVGNPGNPGEVQSQGTFGAVDYNYVIGKFPVTNDQYTVFLNAVAADDPFALYSTEMNSSMHGGIRRGGLSGSFTYTTKPGMGNKPVNWVSWYDAIRFANWLHNGQGGPGTTEDGAYTLGPLGAGGIPIDGSSITRNPGAKWWLPSEDEWYKAAYHKNDGVTGNYWRYPTASDSVPVAEPPPGGANSANYNTFAVGTVTDVGAYVDSPSPYGTFDQGGNVWEWNEAKALITPSFQGVRGGSWADSFLLLRASDRLTLDPPHEFPNIGFRVASIPEPATMLLGALATIGLLLWRRR